MMPVLRRTWAPGGATPTVPVRARSHEKVSGIGALIVSPRRRQLTLALALHAQRNIRGPEVLRFLRHLARQIRGPFIRLWDRGRSHKHHLVRAWLTAHPRCHIVWLPPYAPDLNPLELPEVRPLGELRPRHHERHPDGGQPRASSCGSPSRAAEELLSSFGLVVSCLR